MSDTKEPTSHKDATQGLCDMTDPKTPTAPVADEELEAPGFMEWYVPRGHAEMQDEQREAYVAGFNRAMEWGKRRDNAAATSAFDLVEAKAQIAELERKLGEEARLHKVYEDTAEDFGEQLIALRAENRKYREALEKITAPAPLIGSGKTAASQYRAIASEALSMGSGEEKVKCPPHTWDQSGERCTKCGDKDWMT